jgi:signal transduction histidine kinase
LSGFLAAVAFLPTIFPLSLKLINTEELAITRLLLIQAEHVRRLIQDGIPLHDDTLVRLDLAAIDVGRVDGTPIVQLGQPIPDEVRTRLCLSEIENPGVQQLGNQRWALACRITKHHQVIVARPVVLKTNADVILTVLLLALAVGLITAFSILQVLRPVSAVSSALARVRAGERGVRIKTTGLRELDEIVYALNDAAAAMENREDAILARIQVVQEMARLVAHEVRNPLQSMQMLTSLIASEKEGAERAEIANAIHNEIRTLDKVVERLLRKGALDGALHLRRSVQPIAPIVEQIYNLRHPSAQARGILFTKGFLSWHPGRIDGTILGRSIDNLVLNALQAVQPDQGMVEISVFVEANVLCIAVDDNGPGVDPVLENQIFEPNVTTKTKGSGLGLSLVKGVVVAHGGTINYETSTLGGTRFLIRLPLEITPSSTENDA